MGAREPVVVCGSVHKDLSNYRNGPAGDLDTKLANWIQLLFSSVSLHWRLTSGNTIFTCSLAGLSSFVPTGCWKLGTVFLPVHILQEPRSPPFLLRRRGNPNESETCLQRMELFTNLVAQPHLIEVDGLRPHRS